MLDAFTTTLQHVSAKTDLHAYIHLLYWGKFLAKSHGRGDVPPCIDLWQFSYSTCKTPVSTESGMFLQSSKYARPRSNKEQSVKVTAP